MNPALGAAVRAQRRARPRPVRVGDATQLPQLKGAADTFIDALVGTPSEAALFSFSTDSPAEGATQNYPGLTVGLHPGRRRRGQVALRVVDGRRRHQLGPRASPWPPRRTATYDIVGRHHRRQPHVLQPARRGPGQLHAVSARWRTASSRPTPSRRRAPACSRWASGTGVSDAATGGNLRAISGPTAYDGTNAAHGRLLPGVELRRRRTGAAPARPGRVRRVAVGGQAARRLQRRHHHRRPRRCRLDVRRLDDDAPASRSATTERDDGLLQRGQLPAHVRRRRDLRGRSRSRSSRRRARRSSRWTVPTRSARDLDTGAGRARHQRGGHRGFTVDVAEHGGGELHGLQPGRGARDGHGRQGVGDQRRRPVPEGNQPAGFTSQLTLTGPGGAAATDQPWQVTRTGLRRGGGGHDRRAGHAAGPRRSTPTCARSRRRRSSRSTAPTVTPIPRPDRGLPGDARRGRQHLHHPQHRHVRVAADPRQERRGHGRPDAVDPVRAARTGRPGGPAAGPERPGRRHGSDRPVSVTAGVPYQLAESGGPADVPAGGPAHGPADLPAVDRVVELHPGRRRGQRRSPASPTASTAGSPCRSPSGSACTATNQTAQLALAKEVVNDRRRHRRRRRLHAARRAEHDAGRSTG